MLFSGLNHSYVLDQVSGSALMIEAHEVRTINSHILWTWKEPLRGVKSFAWGQKRVRGRAGNQTHVTRLQKLYF